MDKPDTPHTEIGRIHGLLAVIAFAAISTSGFRLTIAFANDPTLQVHTTIVKWLAWIVTAASLITLLSLRTRVKYVSFGIFERLIYLGMFGLLAYSASVLI